MMPRAIAACLAGILAAVLAAPLVQAQAQWRRLDTPNFVLIGDVDAKQLRGIATEFEGFRDA